MSYKSMLKHRCTVLVLREQFLHGSPVHVWTPVRTNVRCFLDLNFVRLGKDPTWTPEAGRPTTRAGVGFFLGTAPIEPGCRIKMTKGPSGTFVLGGAVDEAWTPNERHHLEVSAQEVPGQILRGNDDFSNSPDAVTVEPASTPTPYY